MSRPPRPPEEPTPGPNAATIHDLVAAAAASVGYGALAAVVGDRGRRWRAEHDGGLHVFEGDDPRLAALVHLADALVRLQQAVREQDHGARVHYEAVLMVAGNLARQVPLAAALHQPHRRGDAA